MSFGEIQLHSQVTDDAFGYIREALLREIGVRDGSGLFDETLRKPLGDWDPALELRGHYRDSAADVMPGLTQETALGDWPDFSGLGLIPYLSRVEDRPDGRRDIELKIRGDLDLAETQTVGFDSTLWVLPGVEGEPPPAGERSRLRSMVNSSSGSSTAAKAVPLGAYLSSTGAGLIADGVVAAGCGRHGQESNLDLVPLWPRPFLAACCQLEDTPRSRVGEFDPRQSFVPLWA